MKKYKIFESTFSRNNQRECEFFKHPKVESKDAFDLFLKRIQPTICIRRECKLHYLDREGDRVSIGSHEDMEFMYEDHQHNENPIKLFFTLSGL
jgi:hypothetical protein